MVEAADARAVCFAPLRDRRRRGICSGRSRI